MRVKPLVSIWRGLDAFEHGGKAGDTGFHLLRDALRQWAVQTDWKNSVELYAAKRAALAACIFWGPLDELRPTMSVLCHQRIDKHATLTPLSLAHSGITQYLKATYLFFSDSV